MQFHILGGSFIFLCVSWPQYCTFNWWVLRFDFGGMIIVVGGALMGKYLVRMIAQSFHALIN
jgi:hypothetical protein